MKKEFWKSQITYISQAAGRSRWIMLASAVASLAIIGVTYNFIFGYSRAFAKQLVFQNNNKFIGEENGVLQHLQKELLKNWIEQFSLNFSILGVKYSVLDSGVIGAAALLIASVWMFYSFRRENHLIGKTLIMAAGQSNDIKRFVYHGTIANIVMGGVSGNDRPIYNLASRQSDQQSSGISNWLIAPVFFMPAIAIFIIIAADMITIFAIKGLFRGSDSSVYEYLRLRDMLDLTTDLQIFGPLIIEFIVLVLSTILCFKSFSFQDGTIQLLRECNHNKWGDISTDDIEPGDVDGTAPPSPPKPTPSQVAALQKSSSIEVNIQAL